MAAPPPPLATHFTLSWPDAAGGGATVVHNYTAHLVNDGAERARHVLVRIESAEGAPEACLSRDALGQPYFRQNFRSDHGAADHWLVQWGPPAPSLYGGHVRAAVRPLDEPALWLTASAAVVPGSGDDELAGLPPTADLPGAVQGDPSLLLRMAAVTGLVTPPAPAPPAFPVAPESREAYAARCGSAEAQAAIEAALAAAALVEGAARALSFRPAEAGRPSAPPPLLPFRPALMVSDPAYACACRAGLRAALDRAGPSLCAVGFLLQGAWWRVASYVGGPEFVEAVAIGRWPPPFPERWGPVESESIFGAVRAEWRARAGPRAR
eukprot:tig00000681_g3089.t1